MTYRILVLLSALLLGFGRDAVALDRSETLTHDGLERRYRVIAPDRKPADPRGWPLVMVLHGGGGSGGQMARVSDFGPMARREGFVAVFPNAMGKHWNDGRQANALDAQGRNVDDVGFLLALVEHLSVSHQIDGRRIYALGPSNGGMMVQRIACEAGERFAAMASVIANMPEPLITDCRPNQPVAMMLINGTADPMIPWLGGPVGLGRQDRGRVISTRETVDHWIRTNGCNAAADSFLLPDKDPGDGVLIRASRWQGCRQGAEVLLYAMDGAGHRWPGEPRAGMPLLKRLMGPLAMDIEAEREIWAFFKAHRR